MPSCNTVFTGWPAVVALPGLNLTWIWHSGAALPGDGAAATGLLALQLLLCSTKCEPSPDSCTPLMPVPRALPTRRVRVCVLATFAFTLPLNG